MKKKQENKLNQFLNTLKPYKDIPINREHVLYHYIYKLFPYIEISNYHRLNDKYKLLFNQYQNDNYTFKHYLFYLFNPLAFIFGLIYFAQAKLYLGLIFVVSVTILLSNFLFYLSYTFNFFIPALDLLFLCHFICALSANFFLVHKTYVLLQKEIKNKNNIIELDILKSVHKKSTRFKTFHVVLGFTFIALLNYFILAFSFTDFSAGIGSGFKILENTLLQDINQSLNHIQDISKNSQ